MFPPPDFESGASTNSATGAWGEDNSGGVCAVNAEMPLSEGRQRDAESLCAQLAPQALALLERVSVALNQSGALSPGLSWRPPAPYPPRMREGEGELVPHGAALKGTLNHAWHAGIEAIASGGVGGGPGGRRRRRHHTGGVLFSIRDGAAAVPALP